MTFPNHPSPPATATLTSCGQVAITVAESTQVGEARRTAVALAAGAGFDETRAGQLAILVTELATNLVRHGRGGELVIRVSHAGAGAGGGVEVLALDRGPGIADVGRALRDGFSSGATPGTGLGAARRLAARFELWTQPGAGTAIWALVPRDAADAADAARAPARGAVGPAAGAGPLDVGVVSIPYPGELRCGDGWSVFEDPAGDRASVMVVDGLGHGAAAHAAASLAVETFQARARDAGASPASIVGAVHAALRPTRGAAVAVAELSRERRTVRYCGVGNIAGALVRAADGTTRNLISHNGTAGVEARRIQELAEPWPPGALLVMHSDGLTSRWSLAKPPGLAHRAPPLIAGVLYRDHRRGRDDVTVLVAGERASPSAFASAPASAGPPRAADGP